MDSRWAPAAAGLVAALVVGGAVVALDDDGPRARRDVVTLPPPAAEPSDSPQPEPSAAARPTPQPQVGVTAKADASPRPTSAPEEAADPEPLSTKQPPAASPRPSKAPQTASPPAAPSAAPRPSPTAGRATFSFDTAYGTDDPREVIVQYGDSSSCPHARVTYTVRESADRVVVTLEADAMDPGRACTADYRQMLVPLRLQQPIGDRALIDGHRGEAVPVDRSCRRQFENPPPPKDCEPA